MERSKLLQDTIEEDQKGYCGGRNSFSSPCRAFDKSRRAAQQNCSTHALMYACRNTVHPEVYVFLVFSKTLSLGSYLIHCWTKPKHGRMSQPTDNKWELKSQAEDCNFPYDSPRWLTPSCISKPSTVLEWGHIMMPALLISMFTCFSSNGIIDMKWHTAVLSL